MTDTYLFQGHFVADGNDKILYFPSGVDWIEINNYTEYVTPTLNGVFNWYWQKNVLDPGNAFYSYHPAADNTVAVDATAGGGEIYYIDSSNIDPDAKVAVTQSSNDPDPTFLTGDTGALQTGSVVRVSDLTNAPSICGFDFEIDAVIDGVSFDMRWAMANSPGAVGTNGYYRHIPYPNPYYPPFRYIVDISQSATAVIETSVTHEYTVGQRIRVYLPSPEFGMTEIHKKEGTITAVTANTITTNIDTSAMTAFTFALPADVPFTFPTVVPVGMDTAQAITSGVSLTADATRNISYIGLRLVGGANHPAGALNNQISWRAGKSFSNLE